MVYPRTLKDALSLPKLNRDEPHAMVVHPDLVLAFQDREGKRWMTVKDEKGRWCKVGT